MKRGKLGWLKGLGRGAIALAMAIGLAGEPLLAQTGTGSEVKIMAADAHPEFEVATIRPSDPDQKRDGFDVKGRHVLMESMPVMTMLIFAYNLSDKQVVGAPEWVRSEHFNVDGVPDVEGTPNVPQMQEMIQKLLSDRFGLKVHHEKRDLSGYALTPGTGGLKITKSKGDPNGLPRQDGHANAGQRDIVFTNNTMAEFALGIQYFMDKPVVDRTGLTGRWDFELKWTFDDTHVPEEGAAPGIFTAVQEQLGLKLEAVKAPTDVLVVEKVDRPSAN